MAKFVPVEQQTTQATGGARFVPVQPAAPTTGPRIADMPRPRTGPGPQSVQPYLRPTRSEIAQYLGMGEGGAPSDARYRFSLGSPTAKDDEAKIELARRALGTEAEIRIGPETGELEFKMPGQDRFSFFNAPGLDTGDITGSAPEAGVLVAGVAGGTGGFFAGSTMGPLAAGAGTVAGTGAGEATGELIRLTRAAERGLIDLTPNEIMDRALRRGGMASASTVVGGAAAAALRRTLAATMGVPVDLMDALGDKPMREAMEEARQLSGRVEAATGDRLPMTVGQVARSPEVIRAESAAMTSRETGRQLRGIGEEQNRVIGNLADSTFREPVDAEGRAEVGRSLVRQSVRNTRNTERILSQAEQRAFSTARVPEDAINTARQSIEAGREQVFAPLRQQFDQLQQEKGIRISFAPVRAEAGRLRQQEGQSVLPSISLQEQSKLLQQAERAGMREETGIELGSDGIIQEVQRWVDEPPTLGETQRVLRDIRRELRRPGISDEPQRERILSRMEQSIVQTRNQALDEESLQRVLGLEQQYAEATRALDRGIVGDFMSQDQRTGLFRIQGEQAIDRLLRGPTNVQQFRDALGVLPNAQSALLDTQDAALGMIQRRFLNDDTGRIDPNRLGTFLRNNRESLAVLFEGRPGIVESLGDARRASVVFNRAQQQQDAMLNRMEKLVGLRTADPARLASELLSRSGPRDARIVRNLLPDTRRDLFDRSLSSNVRDSVSDTSGKLDPNAIDQFLQSDQALVTREILGESYNENLGLIRDVLRAVDRDLERPVPLDLSTSFARAQPGLQGLLRFARVPFAPLSARGRAFTASMGVASEHTQRQLAKAMADPEGVAQLARLGKVTLGSRAADRILGRLGMEPFIDAIQSDPLRGEPIESERQEDAQRGTLTP